MGTEVASLAVQVHGGMGYIEETGIAQRYRDIRIAAIYEGTNGIQAMDLVGRKLPMRAGGVVDDFLERARSDSTPSVGDEWSDCAVATSARTRPRGSSPTAPTEPNDALAAATPYLRMFGIVAGGWVMARQAIAARKLGLDEKLTTARFYLTELLPQAAGLLPAVTAGKDVLFALTPSQLDTRR